MFGVGVDEPIRMTVHGRSPTSQSYYYVQDAIGSTVALVDANGSVSERYRYLAFGKEEIAGGAEPRRFPSTMRNPLRFQGRWMDLESGLYQFRSRYYDPETGRFTSRDSIDPPAASALANTYVFTANSPSNAVDPFGMETVYTSLDQIRLQAELQDINLRIAAAHARNASDHQIQMLEIERNHDLVMLDMLAKDDNFRGAEGDPGVFAVATQQATQEAQVGAVQPAPGSKETALDSIIRFFGYNVDASAVAPTRDVNGEVSVDSRIAAIQASNTKSVVAASSFLTQAAVQLLIQSAGAVIKAARANRCPAVSGAAGNSAVEATKANYRSLFLATGVKLPAGWEVHHSLPQQFADIMVKEMGVNVHEVQWLRGVDPKIHAVITNAWAAWAKALGRAPTGVEVLNFAGQVEQKFARFFIYAK